MANGRSLSEMEEESGSDQDLGGGEYSDDDMLPNTLGNEENDELDALNREYEELQKQEDELVNRLKRRSEDQEKEEAVRHQKVLWDRALETRIAMQKLVTGANQLPDMQEKLVLCESDPEIEKAYTMLVEAAIASLDGFLELKQALIEQNDSVAESDAVGAVSRKQKGDSVKENLADDCNLPDSIWECIDTLYSSITPFRNSSVDRWQRKTQLATGAAVAKGKLQAFNQSISQQLVSVMRDPTQLIDNIRLRHSAQPNIDQPTHDSLENGGLSSADTNGNSEVDAVDLELLDDSDFYQHLLLEFLESTDPSRLGGLQSARKQRTKKRKTVDRRASKGRKIRYNVLEPLVNFMAPEPMVVPPMASKLFANLFGQKGIVPVS